MGGFSRSKGKRAEGEVRILLQAVVNRVWRSMGRAPDDDSRPRLQRNTLQSDAGGVDIVGLEFIALEVKFREALSVPSWWKQTVAQCKPHQTAVLFYRKSRQPWTILLQEPQGERVTMTLAEFDAWLANRLLVELK